MKYTVKIGSGTKFYKDWFSRSKIDGEGVYTDTHRQQGDLISLLLFFKIKKVG
jgi:hypothetical protein